MLGGIVIGTAKIEKILNNNVVIISDDSNDEVIVMGKGLAFGKKVNDLIDLDNVDKKFTLKGDASSKFQELIVDIPIEHINVSEKIVSHAKVSLGKKINEVIYISLVDHIYTSIVRYNEGIVVPNSLMWDLQRFYPDEFKVGLWALDLIEKEFDVRLPDDEAGFIALHLVNATMDQDNISDMYKISKIMQEVTNIIKYEFNVEFNEDSVYYYRFITHLKFFAQRLIERKIYNDGDDELLSIVKVKYKNSYACANKIGAFIFDKYDYVISDEEKMYLTVHIERVIYKI